MPALNFNIERFTHQIKVMECKKKFIFLVGGYGCGKSFTVGMFSILHSIVDNGIMHQVISPNYSMAKKTVIPAIYDILENRIDPPLVYGRDFAFNKTEHTFYITKWNGCIVICSGHSPENLNGPTIGSFAIDEPGQQKYTVWEKMIARLREPRAKWLQGGLFGTPEGMNWFYDICEGDKRPKTKTGEEEYELIRAKTSDNVSLPETYIDTLYQQYDAHIVDAYVNGFFVPLESGIAYYSFDEKKNILDDEFKYNENEPLIIGHDFNYDPMTIVICQEAKINNEWVLVLFDEIYRHNCDTDAICEMLINKYGKSANYEIYPDPACKNRSAHGSGKSDLLLIKNSFVGLSYSVNMPSASPTRKDRLNSVNKMFCNAKSERHLYITRNCKNVLNDIRKVTMEEYLNGNFKDPQAGHITDALGYIVSKRHPVKIDRSYYTKAE